MSAPGGSMRRSGFRLSGLAPGLLLVLALAAGDARALPLPPNSLDLRIGYHSFFGVDSTQRLDDLGVSKPAGIECATHPESLDGVSGEIVYARRFHDMFSLAVSAGVYGGRSSSMTTAEKARVSGSWSVVVVPVLLTPRLHLRLDPVDLYAGAGGGIYFVTTDFRLKVDDSAGVRHLGAHESRSVLGWHVLLGIEWRFHRNWGALLEDRFAFAPVRGGSRETGLGDFDAGGNDIVLGVRWHF